MANLIPFHKRITLLIRSFFIQSFWNYHNYQATGFLFILNGIRKYIPILNSDEKVQFFKRNYIFYNGHPYFVGIPIAVVARTEIESTELFPDTPVQKFREAITGPLGAIGDVVFWSNIRPLFLTIPVYFYILNLPLNVILFSIAATFLVYNFYHLRIRWWAFSEGLELGFKVCQIFNMRHFEKMIQIFGRILMVTLFAVLSSLTIDMGTGDISIGLTLAILICIIFLLRFVIRNPVFLIIIGLFLIWLLGRYILK